LTQNADEHFDCDMDFEKLWWFTISFFGVTVNEMQKFLNNSEPVMSSFG
jgi:hypothetical protein